MVDRGRVVLEGAVTTLRVGSGERRLRLTTDDDTWLAAVTGVEVVSRHADEIRLRLSGDADPLAVLDAARAAGLVHDFGLDLPTLSELFLAAAGDRAPAEVQR